MIFSRTFRWALAALAFTAAAWAGDPTGTWTFAAEGPNGRRAESTLQLTWADGQLTGTIDNQAGKAEISDATFVDDQISFSVERKFRRRTFTVRYTGRLEGDTITGTVETTGRNDQPISLPWTAKRTS